MYKLIGKKISQARKLKGLTQEQFAEKCKLSVSTVSRTETGVTSTPLHTLCRMCDELDIGLDFILYDLLPKEASSVHPLVAESSAILETLDESHKLFFLNVLKAYVNALYK